MFVGRLPQVQALALALTAASWYFSASGMSKFLVYTSRKYAVRATSRAFSTCSSNGDEKPVMNRYSRTVTQPKDQGASQVSFEFALRLIDDHNRWPFVVIGDALCH